MAMTSFLLHVVVRVGSDTCTDELWGEDLCTRHVYGWEMKVEIDLLCIVLNGGRYLQVTCILWKDIVPH